jgi:hypothetical protein
MKREDVKRDAGGAICSRLASSRFTHHSGRSHWTAVAFLFVFTLLLIGVCYYFLFPALEAWKHAPPADRAKLRAYASLLLSIILIVLICGLLLTVRIGRFFFPRPASPRTRTKYVDAWSESAKRMETPPEDEESGAPPQG